MKNTIYELTKMENGEAKGIHWGTIDQIEAYLKKQDYFNWILENEPALEGDRKYSIKRIEI